MAKMYEDKRGSFVRDTFGLHTKQAPASHQSNMSNVNVVITDVAWSKPLPHRYNYKDNANAPAPEMMDDNPESGSRTPSTSKKHETTRDSIVAAAGSNGVVVVWSARRAFLDGDGSGNSMANQQPEAILSQHSRAVNRLAWHPERPGLLLTGSQVCNGCLPYFQFPDISLTNESCSTQDATVKLWTRIPIQNKEATPDNSKQLRSWFQFKSAPSYDDQIYSWQCRATFEPKSEPVRDIRWSPFLDDG